MKDKDTPLKMVRGWEKTIPGIYDCLTYLHGAKADGEIWWPDHCLLPINSAHTYLVNAIGLTKEKAAEVAAEITACWIWRQNKIIYSFDPDLVSVLADQAKDIQDEEVLPFDLLLHLPYPCIYVKAPSLVEYIDGFFAWIDYDVNRHGNELRIQMVSSDYAWSIPLVIHMIPGATINEWVADTLKTTLEVSGRAEVVDFDKNPHLAGEISVLLSCIEMLLYITAANADIINVPSSVRSPSPAGGKILDKASEVQQMAVGIRVGSALRQSRYHYPSDNTAAGTGRTVRSHARRGHWHHYWTGPLDGERKLILKWTAPTIIHPDEGSDDVVVHPVK